MSEITEVKVKLTGGCDDECIPIQCLCGHGEDNWTFVINIEDTNPTECPECGRKYFWKCGGIKIFLVEDKLIEGEGNGI